MGQWIFPNVSWSCSFNCLSDYWAVLNWDVWIRDLLPTDITSISHRYVSTKLLQYFKTILTIMMTNWNTAEGSFQNQRNSYYSDNDSSFFGASNMWVKYGNFQESMNSTMTSFSESPEIIWYLQENFLQWQIRSTCRLQLPALGWTFPVKWKMTWKTFPTCPNWPRNASLYRLAGTVSTGQ